MNVITVTAVVEATATHPDGLTDEQVADLVARAEKEKQS